MPSTKTPSNAQHSHQQALREIYQASPTPSFHHGRVHASRSSLRKVMFWRLTATCRRCVKRRTP